MRTKKFLPPLPSLVPLLPSPLLNVNSIQSGKTFLATPMTEAEREFITFVAENRRSYGTKEEYEYRLSLFTAAYERVNSQDNTVGHSLAINRFADMSTYEYKQMLGYRADTRVGKKFTTFMISDLSAAPASVDWANNGKTQGPKDQG